MTEIVSGTVVHWNPGPPPVFDPDGTKQITVDLPTGSDDLVAAVAIVSKCISDIKKPATAKQMLDDASKGFVRVLDLKRTIVPTV
jgi:hypothetical protein